MLSWKWVCVWVTKRVEFDKTGFYNPNLDGTGCVWHNLTYSSTFVNLISQSWQEECTFWEGAETEKKGCIWLAENLFFIITFGFAVWFFICMLNV